MSFVQGRLRKQPVSIEFATRCACCDRSLSIEIDDALRWHVGQDASPLVFAPLVSFEKLKEPSIVEAF